MDTRSERVQFARAKTTDSVQREEHDSLNIIKTRTEATTAGGASLEVSTSVGPNQEKMGGDSAHARHGTTPVSSDLSQVGTPFVVGEDSKKINELMELCTSMNKVILKQSKQLRSCNKEINLLKKIILKIRQQ